MLGQKSDVIIQFIFLNNTFVTYNQQQTWKWNIKYNTYLNFYEDVFKKPC